MQEINQFEIPKSCTLYLSVGEDKKGRILLASIVEELTSTQLGCFLDMESSTIDNLFFYVYQNERKNVFYGWGREIGIFLFPPFDRQPLSDDAGKHTVNGLSNIKTLSNYQWSSEWQSQDPSLEYEYADDWFKLVKSANSGTREQPSSVVRRKKLVRTMTRINYKRKATLDIDNFNSTFFPFTLSVKVLRGNLAGPHFEKMAFVEFVFDGVVLGRTTSMPCPPSWATGYPFSKSLVAIDKTAQVVCNVYMEKPWGLRAADRIGHVILPADHLWVTRNKKLVCVYKLIPDRGSGTIELEIELKTSYLFDIKPIFDVGPQQASLSRQQLEREFDAFGTPKVVRRALFSASTCADVLTKHDLVDVLADISALSSQQPAGLDPDCSSSTPGSGSLPQAGSGAVFSNRNAPVDSFGFSAVLNFTSEMLGVPLQIVRATNERLRREWPTLISTHNTGAVASSLAMERMRNAFEFVVFLSDGREIGVRISNMMDYVMVLATLARVGKRDLESSYQCAAELFAEDGNASLRARNSVRASSAPPGNSGPSSSGRPATVPITPATPVTPGTGKLKQSPSIRNILKSSAIAARQSFGRGVRSEEVRRTWQRVLLSVNEGRNYAISWTFRDKSKSKAKASQRPSGSTLNLSSIHFIEMKNAFWFPYTHVLEMEVKTVSNSGLGPTGPQACCIDVIGRHGRHERIKSTISDKAAAVNRDISIFVSEDEAVADFTNFSADVEGLVKVQVSLEVGGKKGGVGAAPSTSSSPSLPFTANDVWVANIPVPVESRRVASNDRGGMYEDRLTIKVDHSELAAISCKRRVCSVKLVIQGASNVLGVDTNISKRDVKSSDPYLLVYMLDCAGNIIPPPVNETVQKKSLIPVAFKSAPKQQLYLFKSVTHYSTTNPIWADAIIDLSSVAGFNHAAYFLVELWDENTILHDECLGEVCIPMSEATHCPQGFNPQTKQMPIKRSRKLSRQNIEGGKKLERLDVSLEHEGNSLGVLSYTIQNLQQARRGSLGAKESVDPLTRLSIKTVVTVVQPQDYFWPAQLLFNEQDQGSRLELEFGVLSGLFAQIAFGGLSIKMLGGKRENSASSRQHDFLRECQELDRSASKGLKAFVSWEAVRVDNCIVLCDSMLVVEVHFSRRLVASSGDVVLRQVQKQILLGPCPALRLHELMEQRKMAHSFRIKILNSTCVASTESAAKELMNEIQTCTESIVDILKQKNEFYSMQIGLISGTAASGAENGTEAGPLALMGGPRFDIDLRRFALKRMRYQGYFGFLVWILATKTSEFATQPKRFSLVMLERRVQQSARRISESAKPLVDRVEEMIFALSDEVRSMILTELALSANASLTDFADTLASKLRCLIHAHYTALCGFLHTAVEGPAFENLTDPQSKSALLKLLISKDDWIDWLLTPFLLLFEMKFDARPLLSSTLNFDSLINKFSVLLTAEIKMWEGRTVDQYLKSQWNRSVSRESAAIVPWEVEEVRRRTLTNATVARRPMLISTLPELINEQLHIQIGAKKILACDSLSPENMIVVKSINSKIATAVATSYVSLARHYRQALATCTRNLLRERTKKVEAKDPGGLEDYRKRESIIGDDEIHKLNFLMACANDSERIVSKHIPHCQEELFSSDRIIDTDLFDSATRAFGDTAIAAVTLITDVVFDDLREILLGGFDEMWIAAHFDELDQDEVIQIPSTYQGTDPVEVIIATLREFRENVVSGLIEGNQSVFMNVCSERLVARYLLFLMDTLCRPQNLTMGRTSSVRPSIVKQGRRSQDPPIVYNDAVMAVVIDDYEKLENFLYEGTRAVTVEEGGESGQGSYSRGDALQHLHSVIKAHMRSDAGADFSREAFEDAIEALMVNVFVKKMPRDRGTSTDVAYDEAIRVFLGVGDFSPDPHALVQTPPQGSGFQLQVLDLACVNMTVQNSRWKFYLRLSIHEDSGAAPLLEKPTRGHQCTRIKFVQASPTWDESITFPLETLENKFLLIEVMEHVPFNFFGLTSDNAHAYFSMPLSGIDAAGADSVSGWYMLSLKGAGRPEDTRIYSLAKPGDEARGRGKIGSGVGPSSGPLAGKGAQIRIRIKVTTI